MKQFGLRLPITYGGSLWTLVSLSLVTGGFTVLWRIDHPRTSWKPSVRGKRFRSVVLYTREDCGLCEEAHRLLARYQRYLPELVEVDIDRDESLKEKFNTCVPVVEFDGQVRFRGHVSEPLLQRLIEGTPPVFPPRARFGR